MIGLTNAIVAVIAFLITWLSGYIIIPYLTKLKFGQTIKEIGPTWHKNKQGTPTMGGIMFIAGICIAAVAGYLTLRLSGAEISKQETVKFFAGLVFALAFGFVGFVDDYIKVVKKQNLGLTAMQKVVMQVVIAVAYLFTVASVGDTSTIVIFPFLGQLDFGIFYYPIVIVGIIFFVNAVNLTDGVDGLASSVTFVVSIGFMAVCMVMRYQGLELIATAMAAGCLGFLMWNFHPAKVFMGDTGSMFLGGAVVALGLGIGIPVLIFIIGFVYLCEALSVVLQVISFKTTGKRIFKMSPIHHHFEMCKWSEVKIVVVFSLVSFVFAIISVVAVMNI